MRGRKSARLLHRKRAHWITFKEEQRLDWQKEFLSRLCQADPEVQETYELIQSFTTMLRERQGERLDEWLERVSLHGVSELQSFAQGLHKDYDAGSRRAHPPLESGTD